jgi:Asp-tRNA(Asn)/Glu-tRNA(Gln) amidotransferase A subunit family amidase
VAGPVRPADESSSGRRFAWSEAAKPAHKLRVAVPKGCTEKVQPAVRENFDAALARLGDSIVVTRDVEWPDLPWGPSMEAIVTAEGASTFLELIESGDVTQLKCPAGKTGGYRVILSRGAQWSVEVVQGSHRPARIEVHTVEL